MRAVIQRVNRCSVTSEGKPCGSIDKGLCLLLGVAQGDGMEQLNWMVEKICNLRIFEDEAGKMNLSLLDVKGQLMVVSQFTLLGDCRKGRRPSFVKAAPPEVADGLYNCALQAFRDKGLEVQQGVFQTHMVVSLDNDGPVTFVLDTEA